MSSIGEANKQSVVKMVQEMLQRSSDKSSITPSLIALNIEMVLGIMPEWKVDLDREAVSDELIRRFSIWIGKDSLLVNNEGHEPWLKPERKREWRYWQRYREWQEKRLPWAAVEKLDASTDEILGLLEDPERKGAWDRRGLVVGHVQSGKTGNYTGLICKAADAGYKIIIVLAGMHNNLRSQTQMRLDEGFLGFETSPLHEDNVRVIGVGEIDTDFTIRPNYATNRSEKGDFSTKSSKNLGISPEQRPWLFVVKKNKTVLERLYKWINNHVANTTDAESGRKLVTHLPLLIIDDEADNASVDTGENVVNQDGIPDEEHQPTAINRLIRKILHSFQRKAYVGYTATPFANIFIHERGATAEEGDDLFPSAFISNLAAPSNYIGPARVFGLSSTDNPQAGLPLVKKINDHCTDDCKTGWMPLKHRNGHKPRHHSEHGMPDSLQEAIDVFLLVCAIRNLRGQKDEHSSMLVHVTRFNAVQKDVHEQVETYLCHIKQRLHRKIDHKTILQRLESLWEKDFIPTTNRMCQEWPDLVNVKPVTWQQIEETLPDVVDELSVRMINGTAKDALDYADSAGGLKVIAIGGDKLARGLTLEGLCVSYFLRASRMYDTLMQMGRWFGYRPGYLDLCRLYTTSDLIEWFKHIADAAEELREEFDIMADTGSTPREYGLKVKSHPVLLVTSRLKMRSAKSLWLSFSGSIVETVSLFKERSIVEKNFQAFNQYLRQTGGKFIG
ncbi:Z1 domain-containing protein [Patescibacteria group bacterium]|nr:Z1 domain-containing protein [Patescibacteria group bacterium]